VRTIGVSQTNAELRRHLQEQVGFLCRSCDSFDAGHEDEAKRLAAVLRVMLHDTASSKSLLGLLGMLPNLLMYDTASHIHPRNLASTDGLTIMRLTVTPESGADAGYEAPLDEPRPDAPACLRSFSDWWERAAVKDSRGRSFSRRDLVLRVANKDGGSHVDPQLDAAYAALTRDNSMGWTFGGGDDSPRDFPPPHLASIRQVAHEVLSTLAWKASGAFVDLSYPRQHCRAELDLLRIEGCKEGRNDLCPCGSGAKYKKCHGKN
jgi:hypothetical protein